MAYIYVPLGFDCRGEKARFSDRPHFLWNGSFPFGNVTILRYDIKRPAEY